MLVRRSFVDLWIRPKDVNEAKAMAKRGAELGYNLLAIEAWHGVKSEEKEEVRRFSRDLGIDVAFKVVIEASKRKALLKALRDVRRKFEIVTVICKSREASMVAARDRRVDTLCLEMANRLILDRHMASIFTNALEIPIGNIIFSHNRDHALSFYYQLVKSAIRFRLSLVTSSSALNPQEMRPPKQMASIVYLLGASKEVATDSVSLKPANIISTNRFKLSDRYVEEGVWIED